MTTAAVVHQIIAKTASLEYMWWQDASTQNGIWNNSQSQTDEFAELCKPISRAEFDAQYNPHDTGLLTASPCWPDRRRASYSMSSCIASPVLVVHVWSARPPDFLPLLSWSKIVTAVPPFLAATTS